MKDVQGVNGFDSVSLLPYVRFLLRNFHHGRRGSILPDDIVNEVWIEFRHADPTRIHNFPAWAKTVARIRVLKAVRFERKIAPGSVDEDDDPDRHAAAQPTRGTGLYDRIERILHEVFDEPDWAAFDWYIAVVNDRLAGSTQKSLDEYAKQHGLTQLSRATIYQRVDKLKDVIKERMKSDTYLKSFVLRVDNGDRIGRMLKVRRAV